MARPRGDQQANAERRLQMLETAFEVFANQGFNGSSLKDVAAAASISVAGILHHFGTKNGLLEEVLKLRDQKTGNFSSLLSGAPLDFFREWLLVSRRNDSTPGLVRLFTVLSAEAVSGDHPAHLYFKQRKAGLIDVCEKGYSRAIDAKIVPNTMVARDCSLQLISMVNGMQLNWLYGEIESMESALRQYFSTQLMPEFVEQI